MKRPLVLLAAGLALVLGACAAPTAETPTPPAEVTPASTEAPAPAEPPIPDWMADQPVPAFLDAEQQALFLRAYSAASFLMGCSTSGVDSYPWTAAIRQAGGHETVTPGQRLDLSGGPGAVRPVGGLPSWPCWTASSPRRTRRSCCGRRIWTGAIPHLHRRWGGPDMLPGAGQGSSLEYGWADVPDTYELVSQSETLWSFYLVGHYADLTVQPDETGAARSAQSAGPFAWSAPPTAGGCRNFTCPIE